MTCNRQRYTTIPAGNGRLQRRPMPVNSLDLFISILKSFYKIITSFFYFIIHCKQRLEIYRSSSVQQRFRFNDVELNENEFVKHTNMYSYCGIPARSSKEFSFTKIHIFTKYFYPSRNIRTCIRCDISYTNTYSFLRV